MTEGGRGRPEGGRKYTFCHSRHRLSGIQHNGRRCATPCVAALCGVEAGDGVSITRIRGRHALLWIPAKNCGNDRSGAAGMPEGRAGRPEGRAGRPEGGAGRPEGGRKYTFCHSRHRLSGIQHNGRRCATPCVAALCGVEAGDGVSITRIRGRHALLWIPAKNCGNDRRGGGNDRRGREGQRGAGRPEGGGKDRKGVGRTGRARKGRRGVLPLP